LGKAKNVSNMGYYRNISKYDPQLKDYLKCQQF
jgi:hypothetical protein